MKTFAEKKMLKHNRSRSILFPMVENRVVNVRNACVEKGFQCTVFSNLSEFNTLNGIVPATTLKIDSRNLMEGNGKHTRRKGRKTFKERERERERERWDERYLWTIDQNIKMGFLNIPLASSRIITHSVHVKIEVSPK